MYGAILGDIIGSPYEHSDEKQPRDFPLFVKESVFTDDTVLTIAAADALMQSMGRTDDEIRAKLTERYRVWARRFPDAGYGVKFIKWYKKPFPKPYGSYANGSAMRVSSAGWLYPSLEETLHAARLTAEITHNHPEGIRGAEAVAGAVYLARTGSSREDIRAWAEKEMGYDLSRTCDEIRPEYAFDITCAGTVPPAIEAFLEGNSFEDVIRNAVCLGGDCDTLTCIAGSMAEAFWGVPPELIEECRRRLPPSILFVVDRFQAVVHPGAARG